MTTLDEIRPLLLSFSQEEKEKILLQAENYDQLLAKLPKVADFVKETKKLDAGILALNGASGAGQSYVMKRVENLLEERSLKLPRIYLLGTRDARPDEGHKAPYIFVKENEKGFES